MAELVRFYGLPLAEIAAMNDVDKQAWYLTMLDIEARESVLFIKNIQAIFASNGDVCIESLARQGFAGVLGKDDLERLTKNCRYPKSPGGPTTVVHHSWDDMHKGE